MGGYSRQKVILNVPDVTVCVPVAPPAAGTAVKKKVPLVPVELMAVMVIVPLPPPTFAVHVGPIPIERTAFAALGKVPMANVPGPATVKASAMLRIGLEPSAPPIESRPLV
jgi:hypothetical protein